VQYPPSVAALHLVVPNFFQGVCELVHTCAPSGATNSKKGRCQDTTEHRPYHLKNVHWGRAGQQTVNWPKLLKRRRNADCTAGRALWPLRQRLPADAGSKSLESRPLPVRGGACATSFQVATDRRRGRMNIDVGKLGTGYADAQHRPPRRFWCRLLVADPYPSRRRSYPSVKGSSKTASGCFPLCAHRRLRTAQESYSPWALQNSSRASWCKSRIWARYHCASSMWCPTASSSRWNAISRARFKEASRPSMRNAAHAAKKPSVERGVNLSFCSLHVGTRVRRLLTWPIWAAEQSSSKVALRSLGSIWIVLNRAERLRRAATGRFRAIGES